MSDVSRMLEAIEAGNPKAARDLFPLVYDELRRLAAQKLARERPGHTLDATGLVHEAYLRLVANQQFANRRHFFAAAAEAMRRILIDGIRQKKSLKRGGTARRVTLSEPEALDPDDRLLAIDEALSNLAAEDPLAARVVELRQFAGLGHEEIADALEVTVYQARLKWNYARAWLKSRLDHS